jgi:hypothetical protein
VPTETGVERRTSADQRREELEDACLLEPLHRDGVEPPADKRLRRPTESMLDEEHRDHATSDRSGELPAAQSRCHPKPAEHHPDPDPFSSRRQTSVGCRNRDRSPAVPTIGWIRGNDQRVSLEDRIGVDAEVLEPGAESARPGPLSAVLDLAQAGWVTGDRPEVPQGQAGRDAR